MSRAEVPPPPNAPRGRWAPSPSGLLHVGSARTALAAWASARAAGGSFLWRLEDLDPPRVVPGAGEAALEDLAWLGLDWDEGPDRGGPVGPYAQSERFGLYDEALERLAAAGRLFPCRRSRRDLQALATAPHGAPGLPPYPASFRPERLEPGWFEALRGAAAGTGGIGAALRFRVDPETVTFTDRLQGEITEDVAARVGDFVLQRRDGLFAYQLAVVVDDLVMGVTEVVRATDLLASTGRQIQLGRALLEAGFEGPRPTYGHVPMVLTPEGEKLSKRDGALTLRHLRRAGIAPEQLTGYLAASLGLLEAPKALTPRELLPFFAWDRLSRDDHRLPEDLQARLLRL